MRRYTESHTDVPGGRLLLGILTISTLLLVGCDWHVTYQVRNETPQPLRSAWSSKPCSPTGSVRWSNWRPVGPATRLEASYVTGDYARCIAIADEDGRVLVTSPHREGRTYIVRLDQRGEFELATEDVAGAEDPPPPRSLLEDPLFYTSLVFGAGTIAGVAYGLYLIVRSGWYRRQIQT